MDPQNLENLQGLSKNSKPTNFNNTLLKNLNYIIILQRTVRKYLHKIKSKKKVSIYPIANGINLNTKHIFSKPNTNQNEDQFENGTKINFKPHHRANQSSIRFKTHLSRPSLECSFERKFTVPLEKTTQYVENFRIENALYTGDLLNGMRHGKGVQIWDDGAKYEGEWLFDKANGLGTFYHVDGDIYQGQWENDRANGEGTYINADGARYQGAWVDDIQEGYGVEVWNDGSSYKGYYHEGKKHGFGIYNWADGSMFEGEWRDNKLNGNGVYTWNDGRLFKGDFKDNFMHGEGHYKWGDGREYKGKI